MNKVTITAIIVAAAVIIGVIATFSYAGNSIIKTDDKDKVRSEVEKVVTVQPVTPKKYSVNLTETVGAGNP